MAKIKFLGYLSELFDTREKNLVLEKPKLLKEILPSSFPERKVIILINQKVGNFDSLVNNEDSIIIMPIISGG